MDFKKGTIFQNVLQRALFWLPLFVSCKEKIRLLWRINQTSLISLFFRYANRLLFTTIYIGIGNIGILALFSVSAYRLSANIFSADIADISISAFGDISAKYRHLKTYRLEYEILSYENIGNIGISAITNIGISAKMSYQHALINRYPLIA